MDTSIIQKAGLTESQAKGYLALVEHGKLSPAKAATIIEETRTNTYAVLNKLVELGLATKNDDGKTVYSANHPSNLEALAEKRRRIITRNEHILKQNLSPLIDMFYAASEIPGTRTLQGIEGIKTVYQDILATKQDIYMLPTSADVPNLGADYLDNFFQQRVKLGIHVNAITPDTASGRDNYKSGRDAALLFERTFLPLNTYDSSVEIQVYGSKCAFIAHGETQMATIIDSPPIANVMRTLFTILIDLASGGSDKIKADIKS